MSDSASLLLSLIPAWVAATRGVDIPTSPAAHELDCRVTALRSRLRAGVAEVAKEDVDDEDLAVLSQLCFQLSEVDSSDRRIDFQEAAAAYKLVRRLKWSVDQFGERDEIMADFAVTAWRAARHTCTPAIAYEWERKCQAALSQPSAARMRLDCFLAPSPQLSDLNVQFLSSRSTLFALCVILREQRNADPSKVAEAARTLYEWQSSQEQLPTEESEFIRAETCLLVGTCSRLLGHFGRAEEWLDRAKCLFPKTASAEVGLARVELGYLALSYESHRFDVVLAGMPSLVSKFTSLGMEEESGFCLFLKAAALEECARTDEAIQELLSLREFLAIGTSEPLARLVATKLGELFAQKGRYEEAFQYYREATHRLGAGEWNWVSANVKASVAVTLRDMGKFALAIDIMREALSDFDRVCSIAKAAYSRVLLAEILLLAGREREAEIEILAALPTIRKQSLVREGLAAGKLLREAIRRCGADKASLLGLCEYLRSRV